MLLENVAGAITSNRGRDLRTILETVAASGYRVGALVIDAARFLPQSRQRLFILVVRTGTHLPPALLQAGPSASWHSDALVSAYLEFPDLVKNAWVWWKLPDPPRMTIALTELIDDEPDGVEWHSLEQTQRLLALMSETNMRKIHKAQAYGQRIVGTTYKRIRLNEAGVKVRRAEVRFDQISGCLRTPTGGSSRQIIAVVKGNSIRSRLLSPREAARLMGMPEKYKLPEKYNDAYFLMGDGLAVPVVSWIERHLLTPLANVVRLEALEAAWIVR